MGEYPLINGDGQTKRDFWQKFLEELHVKTCIKDKHERKTTMTKLNKQWNQTPRVMDEIRQLEKVWAFRFDEIRECPNERQCVKFDRISDILKRFFMEQTEEREIRTGNRKWIISFEEILTVYPNV